MKVSSSCPVREHSDVLYGAGPSLSVLPPQAETDALWQAAKVHGQKADELVAKAVQEKETAADAGLGESAPGCCHEYIN